MNEQPTQRLNPATSLPRRVLVLVLPRVHLLDLAGPVQVFDSAGRAGAEYLLEFVGVRSEIRSAQGLTFFKLAPLPRVHEGDLVLVPGCDSDPDTGTEPPVPVEALRWLQSAAQAGAHIASVCKGALVLGEAGLLDGRRCTVHWAHLHELQHRFPQAKVQDGVLYVHDGHVSTSAGITSGIDMALSLVERDYGSVLTAKTARDLLVYLRQNGQGDLPSVYLQYRTHLHPGVHRVQDYLLQDPARKVTPDELSELSGLKPRGLGRAFKMHTGLTPNEYQTRLQVGLARELMHDPRLTLDAISERAGFSDPRHFRRIWKSVSGLTPSASRAALASR